MFIKTAGFKKMIKDAYNGGGLRVINNGDTYTIASSWWAMEIYINALTKKEKAAVIELTGEFPEKDTGYSATKDGNQYEITENRFFDVMAEAGETEMQLIQTLLFMKTGNGKIARVLQDSVTGKIILINQLITQNISKDAVDEENGEYAPEGPLLGPLGDVIWRNNLMAFRVLDINTEEEQDAGINLKMLQRGLWK